eukprot:5403439-Amphidinium_carterae.1
MDVAALVSVLSMVESPVNPSSLVQVVLQLATLVCVWHQSKEGPGLPQEAPLCEVEQRPDLELKISISIGIQIVSTVLLVAVACCCQRSYYSTRTPRTVYRSTLAVTDGSRKSGGARWVICSPEFDIYSEELSPLSADIQE